MQDKVITKRVTRLALYACIGTLCIGALCISGLYIAALCLGTMCIGAALLLTVWRPYLRLAVAWLNQKIVGISSATISVRDQGVGSPTVIIIIGMACKKDDYAGLQKYIAQYTRVLSYDRPGLGSSSRNSEPRTLDVFARDLDELLQVMEVPPPYILVGHSMGGLFIRYYADLHPDSIAGLVFLDTSHEDWFQYIRGAWSEDDQRKYFEFWNDDNPEYTGVRREEKSAFEENLNLVRGLKIDKDMPVLVFTGGRHHHFRKETHQLEADRQAWVGLHASLVAEVESARHIVKWELDHWLHSRLPQEIANEMSGFFAFEQKATQ